MSVEITMSSNALSNLDPSRAMRKIEENLNQVGQTAGDNANAIAPLDTGALRNSLRTTKRGLTVVNVWTVPYAEKVYNTNNKNPHTTEWAEKDIAQNGETYLRIMERGVFE